MTWTKVADSYPVPEVPVIAYVQQALGDKNASRIIRAEWIPKFTCVASDDDYDNIEYSEDKDEYYLTEGWYEKNEFEDTHWKVDGTVTHWMLLPEPPGEDE